MNEKKLCKSLIDRKICGVCGGIAEYLNIDATVIRLLMAVFVIFGPGILFYIVAAIIMPN